MTTELRDGISWELVYKRNKVERLKREKFPLDIIDELPELIKKGYEDIPEEDIVRLYWYGIAHDKPKVGTFMVRLKVPCGIVTPAQLRGVGLIAERYGDNYSELTTRMGIQLHNVRLEHLPDVLQAIQETGLTTTGAEGDTVRNVTGCPLTGINPHEAFDVWPVIDAVHRFFCGHRDYSDLPRKFKVTITACPHQCSGPEFHGVALLGVIHEGRRGFTVRVGGGLSSTPRISRDLRIFVPEKEALDVVRTIADIWREDLRYRLSRPKSRIKFMVDDYGPDEIRAMVEERLGYHFQELPAPRPVPGDLAHLGVHPQKQQGLYYIGYPVPQGWVTGDQLQRLAEVLEAVGGHARFTRLQNFLLAD
ncbi:MAG: nitrite/sulfite reductase, partial [Nitrospinota bacterium]